MRFRNLPLWFALAIFLSASGRAAADDAISAKEHYKTGVKEYDLAHYSEAAKEFEEAYKAKPDPAFLYNLGQAYRLAGEKEKAVSAYRSFLRRSPSTKNRREVEDFISQLQKLVDDEKKTREPGNTLRPTVVPVPAGEEPTTPAKPAASSTPAVTTTAPTAVASAARPVESAATVTAPESAATATPLAAANDAGARPGFAKKVAGGVLLGVGVATAAAGIAFGLMANSTKGDIENPTPGTVYDPSKLDAFQTDRTLAIALGAAGGALAVTGAVVLILGIRDSRRPPVTVAPMVGPTHAGATVRFDF